MTIYYSASTNAFYPENLIDAYKSAGSWPSDAKEVSYEVFEEYSQNYADKVYVPDENGMPKWVERPIDPDEKKQRQPFLIKQADSIIRPLSDEQNAGIISDTDLEKWKAWVAYRKALREVDISADDIMWPAKPE